MQPEPVPSPFTEIVPLSSGRRVAVECYGAPEGTPVFFFHGWPSSRWQGRLAHEAAHALGVRLLSLDRPGVGDSDHQPARRLLDWPPLLAEVADRLGCEKFRALGISGGGPYALVSAWALPERMIGAAVCCGAPPLAERDDVSALMPVYQWLLSFYRRHPQTVRRSFRMIRPLATIRPPSWAWSLLLKTVPATDCAALSESSTRERAWVGYAGSWKGDRDGVFSDAQIYAQPWGFAPEEIEVPIRLWHGKADRNFQWPLAEELAARIPRCTARFLDEEGHYSIAFRHSAAILRDLLETTGGLAAAPRERCVD